jgi:hypothetical protein
MSLRGTGQLRCEDKDPTMANNRRASSCTCPHSSQRLPADHELVRILGWNDKELYVGALK